MKEGKGIKQKTSVHDPWTQTMTWGLMEGGETIGLGGGGQRGKTSGNNCNSMNKNKK